MDRPQRSANFVGNDFFVPQPRQRSAPVPRARFTPVPRHGVAPAPAVAPVTPIVVEQPVQQPQPIEPRTFAVPVTTAAPAATLSLRPSFHLPQITMPAAPRKALSVFHTHSVIAFSLLVLLVGSTGISVYGNYKGAAIDSTLKPSQSVPLKASAAVGPYKVVQTPELEAQLTAISNQSAKVTVGDQDTTIKPEVVRSWLKLVPSKNGKATGIYVDNEAITRSVTELANKYEKAPVNQISSTSTGSSQVIAGGRDGYHLTNPETIKEQTAAIASSLFETKGVAFTTPLATVPFQAVTPAAFPKMIEINISSKQMYLYENGQLYRSYPISAGAAETPTPLGQYKIFSKLPIQDMKGLNPNGTPYSQPRVKWINYFLSGGYAIHGNYWRPASTFGNVNTSHGCASLPEAQAKEVYDWAPMGTTVVTRQ